jgi:hypothetical protein
MTTRAASVCYANVRSDAKILPASLLDPVSRSSPNEAAATEPEITPGCVKGPGSLEWLHRGGLETVGMLD